jgi:hypothetical protein
MLTMDKTHVEPVFNTSGLLKSYKKTPPVTPTKESSFHSSANPLTRTNANLILQVESMLASEKIMAERHALQVASLEQRASKTESRLEQSQQRISELESELAQLKVVLENEHVAAEAVADLVQELVDKEEASRNLADQLQRKIDEMNIKHEEEQEVSRRRISELELMVLTLAEHNHRSNNAEETELVQQVELLTSQVEEQVAGLRLADETVCVLEGQIKALRDQLKAERNMRMDNECPEINIIDSPVQFSSAGGKGRGFDDSTRLSSGGKTKHQRRGPRTPSRYEVEKSLLLSYPAAPTMGLYACHFLEVLDSREALN